MNRLLLIHRLHTVVALGYNYNDVIYIYVMCLYILSLINTKDNIYWMKEESYLYLNIITFIQTYLYIYRYRYNTKKENET